MSVKPPFPFVLNCSRIGLQGGLKTFANEVMRAIIDEGYECEAVVPYGFSVPKEIHPVYTPASLAGAGNLSLLRPIKWLAYSRFSFPVSKQKRVLCTTHHVLPGRSRQIVSVLDLRPYFLPDTIVQKFYFHHMLPRALRHCDGILTISKTSQQMIADVYKVPLDRIAVIPISVRIPAPSDPQPPNLEEPYLLAVGATWSHKNIESLLKQHRLWSTKYGLKVVSGEGEYRTKLRQLAASLGISDRVEFLSDIAMERLEQLYAGCSALVYPSKMEGFGLPPLEAMLRKRPVIVADIPVFRELYDTHAMFVQTEDADSWEKAFASLPAIDSAQLNAAHAHASSFSQARMASALHEALHRFWAL